MSDQELKPCPFCGDEGAMDSGGFRVWWVSCGSCETLGPNSAKNSKDARKLWNRRPTK